MLNKKWKIALSTIGTSLLVSTTATLPLVSCSSVNVKQIKINNYPQSFNIDKKQLTSIFDTINQSNDFNDTNYVNANRFVLNAIFNTVDNQLKSLIKINEVDSKNYVKKINYNDDSQFLSINYVNNKKNYEFLFNRQFGDVYYGGDNVSSIPDINKNQWSNFLSYNNSQYTQEFIESIYHILGIEIEINGGALSPWLTYGYYDNVNKEAIFNLYGYDSSSPFNFNVAINVCKIGIHATKGVRPLTPINNNNIDLKIKNIDSSNINRDIFKKIWNGNNVDLLNLVDILNTITASTIDATLTTLGNNQQTITGIETNLSLLLQSIGNIDSQTSTLANTLLNNLRTNPGSIDKTAIQQLLNQLITLCKTPKTYMLFNNVAALLNQSLKLSYSQYIDLNNLNQSFIDAIKYNNVNALPNVFGGFIQMFNSFNIFKNNKLKEIRENLYREFIERQFNSFAINIANEVAKNWLMITSPNNIYFHSNISFSYLNGELHNSANGTLYLKIVNNTNTQKSIVFQNKTYNVQPNEAFNLYLSLNQNEIVPYVYEKNQQYQLGMKILGNNDKNSYYRIGVFSKDDTNILEKNEFQKRLIVDNFTINHLVACSSQITNVKNIELPKVDITTPQPQSQTNIYDAIKKVFVGRVENTQSILTEFQKLSLAFSKNESTVLQALNDGAASINRLLVAVLNGIADFGNNGGGALVSLINLINLLKPNAIPDPNLNKISNLLQNFHQILNYVPHLYKADENGKIIDLVGTIDPQTNQVVKNQKTVIEMVGNLIQGLLTSYKVNSAGQQEPYALWDFLYDHITDLVGVLSAITPIMNMIPNGITANPITTPQQWKPTYPTSNTSPLDAIIPIITTNLYNQETCRPIELSAMKDIIGGLDSIAPSIEGLISNGGVISPATLNLITNLIKSLAATATTTSTGISNAQSLLTFVSQNGQIISDILKGVNGPIGAFVEVLLTSLTNNESAKDFLNVTIGSLSDTQNNGDFWARLKTKVATLNNPTFTTIVNILSIVGPLFASFVNSVANPIDETGNVINLEEFSKNITITPDSSQNQLTVSFTKNMYFDISQAITKVDSLIGGILGNPFVQNGPGKKYCIALKTNSPFIYDLNCINPTYSINQNKYLVDGTGAHLNKSTNLSSILGFINFTKLNSGLAKILGLVGSFVPSLKPITSIIKELLTLNNSDPSSLNYLVINLLIPGFGKIENIELAPSEINYDANYVDIYNYVDIANNSINNINITDINDSALVQQSLMKLDNIFGSSFWSNITKNLAYFSKDATPTPNYAASYTYTSLVPLTANIKGNKQAIKGIKFNFKSSAANQYTLDLQPLFADTVLTSFVRNLTTSLISSGWIQKPSSDGASVTNTTFTNAMIDFIDKKVNSPITESIMTNLGLSEWKDSNNFNQTTITLQELNNSLEATTGVAVANLSNIFQNIGWIPNEKTKAKFDLLSNFINNASYNQFVTMSVDAPKTSGANTQQTISFIIPNQLANTYALTSKTGNITIKIKFSWPKTLTPTPIAIPTTIQPSTPTINNPQDPKAAFASLATILYNISTNPSGKAFEENFGKIVVSLLSFYYSLVGYNPSLDSVIQIIKNAESTISQLLNLVFENANNKTWWFNIQNVLSILLKLI